MSLSPTWRARLAGSVAAILAVWLAADFAGGSYLLPLLVGAVALAITASWLLQVPIEGLALGFALFGYIVGNRGFAQLSLAPPLPLLPAEAVLLVAGTGFALRCALSRRLPFRNDALNWAVLLYLVAGSARVFFDVRPYGLLAIRDYAMVYYAVYFYLGQIVVENPRSARFLQTVLLIAAVVQPIAGLTSALFPNVLFDDLSIGGVPVIYFKGDLMLTFMTVSALVLAFGWGDGMRRWAWLIGALTILGVVAGPNRASILGALAALAWLALSRVRRFLVLQGGIVALAVLVVVAAALLGRNQETRQKLAAITERVESVVDISGTGTYVTSESGMKGDNNRFRSVWWRTVYDELMAQSPAFGLGFGYDLAHGFLSVYSPDSEDFTARSPHSIVVTVLARMGFVGLGALLVFLAAFARDTWRAMRTQTTPPKVLALWAACWVIFVSACFGVVLEGPMGAVVFWLLLGMAHAEVRKASTAEPAPLPVAATSAA